MRFFSYKLKLLNALLMIDAKHILTDCVHTRVFLTQLFYTIQPISIKLGLGSVSLKAGLKVFLDDLRLKLDFFPPHNFAKCP